VDHLRQLINTLVRIVRRGIDVLCAEVPLLEPVHGTRSPTAWCDSPTESRNSRDPFPSQILTPASESGREDVAPDTNHSRDDGAQEDAFRREGQDGRPSGRGEGEFERLRGGKK
jgi:hypothetical protein